MPSRPRRAVGPLTPHLYVPTRERPVRAKVHRLRPDWQVQPHSHPWAQVAFSFGGVTRLTAANASFTVPPSRALWIPAGVEHAVTVLSEADIHTLYLYQPAGRCGPGALPAAERAAWRQCRVLEVSELLRALVLQLDTRPDGVVPLDAAERAREARLAALVHDELRRAAPVPLGVAMPGDRRLRALCEAVLEQPALHTSLHAWSQDIGASPRPSRGCFRRSWARASPLGASRRCWRARCSLRRNAGHSA